MENAIKQVVSLLMQAAQGIHVTCHQQSRPDYDKPEFSVETRLVDQYRNQTSGSV